MSHFGLNTKQWPLAHYSRGLTQELGKKRSASTRKRASTCTRRLRVCRVHSKRFGECRRVWLVRTKLFGKFRRVRQVHVKWFGKCRQVWRVSQVHEYVLCTKNIFHMFKTVQPTLAKLTRLSKLNKFAKLAFASTLFLSYSPNSPCSSTYFSDILAKLDSHEYLFSTYWPNSTRASHKINTKHAADASASTRTCKICARVAIGY